MATKQTPTQTVTIKELAEKTGIISPTPAELIERAGGQVTTDVLGNPAVDVETAARFLSNYEQGKIETASKWQRYKAFLAAQNAEKRAERAAERKVKEEAFAKQMERHEAARLAALEEKKAADAAAAAAGRELSFDEWEAEHDDA